MADRLHKQSGAPSTNWSRWFSRGSISVIQLAWFVLVMALLALLDRAHTGLSWTVPPFGATMTILIFLPEVPIAQPGPVIIGSVCGAAIGTALAEFGHGAVYAAAAASICVIVLSLLRILHPPAIALSMLPLLLHPGFWFPLAVVLPVTSALVLSAALLSRIPGAWSRPYPLSRRDQGVR